MENKTNTTDVINMTKKNDTKKSATANATKEIVVLETNKGKIEIELNRAKAPISVENFVKYVKMGFYDGTIFHRVIPGFMIQGGGFNVAKREKTTGAPIKLESNNGLKNFKGTIAMARTNNPNSATAQFFINTVDNAFLNYAPGNDGYAVFGTVTSGMDVVSIIESVKTGVYGDDEDWPKEEVIINKAYMK
ncbi:peptidylprolyl isomerase [Candidatus Micrarchaeota archaeon]|nr:peptidylprolyl isomerase [Candidatus Micrarchaeota archaeon]